jgi:hypothetical protein
VRPVRAGEVVDELRGLGDGVQRAVFAPPGDREDVSHETSRAEAAENDQGDGLDDAFGAGAAVAAGGDAVGVGGLVASTRSCASGSSSAARVIATWAASQRPRTLGGDAARVTVQPSAASEASRRAGARRVVGDQRVERGEVVVCAERGIEPLERYRDRRERCIGP